MDMKEGRKEVYGGNSIVLMLDVNNEWMGLFSGNRFKKGGSSFLVHHHQFCFGFIYLLVLQNQIDALIQNHGQYFWRQ